MKTLVQLTLGLMSISLLTACGKQLDNHDIRHDGFVVCGQGALTTFNPQLIDSGITSEALSPQIYDTLLKIDPLSHQPVANLADSWTINATGTEYVFTLHPGIQFQTTDWFTPTRPLDADDVVFSFKRIIDPENPYHKVGGGVYPWFSAIGFQDLVTDVRALDKRRVQFTLSRPNFAFLSYMASAHTAIFSSEYANILAQLDEKNRLDSYPVGTGPFYLHEYKLDDWIRLYRNDHYWRGQVKMRQVVFDVSKRGTGTLAKLLRKECDVLGAPISSQIPTIRATPSLQLTATPAMNVSFIAINTEHPALNDVRVRKALNLAINRQSILDSVYYGTGNKAYNLLPPSSWAYQKDSVKIRHDSQYAKALLHDAGYANGLELSMWVPLAARAYNPSPRKTAELIQSSFAQVGVKLHIYTDKNVERADASNMDLFLTGWIGDSGEPDNFLRPLLSCDSRQSGLNASNWCDKDFDFLLDLALETREPRYRLNLYKQAQNILNEKFPIIPLAHGVQFRANDKSLTGFKASPFNAQPFDTVERIH